VEMLCDILFDLVVLRQYMALGPSNDREVYGLSRILTKDEYALTTDASNPLRGRLQRILTIHEKAFRSSEGGSVGPTTPPKVSNGRVKEDQRAESYRRCCLNRVLDKSLTVTPRPKELLHAYTEQGRPYQFFNAPQGKIPMDEMALTTASCRTTTTLASDSSVKLPLDFNFDNVSRSPSPFGTWISSPSIPLPDSTSSTSAQQQPSNPSSNYRVVQKALPRVKLVLREPSHAVSEAADAEPQHRLRSATAKKRAQDPQNSSPQGFHIDDVDKLDRMASRASKRQKSHTG
jgi:hypothetical protein